MLRRHEMLERAILDDPESLEACLVYADWLSGEGDPRGELIALSCNGAPIERHVRAHRAHLLGPFSARSFHVEWRRGFVDRMIIDAPVPNPREIARQLFDVPACLLLRELEARAELPSVIAGFCELGLPPLVRTLTLGSFDAPDAEREDCPFEAVTSLLPRLSQLEALRVRGPPFWLQAIGPLRARIRSLGIRWNHLSLSFLTDLFAAPWPRLERLVLWFGGNTLYPWELDGPEVRLTPLLQGKGFERLRELSIVNSAFDDRIRPALARSPLYSQLERIDLS